MFILATVCIALLLGLGGGVLAAIVLGIPALMILAAVGLQSNPKPRARLGWRIVLALGFLISPIAMLYFSLLLLGEVQAGVDWLSPGRPKGYTFTTIDIPGAWSTSAHGINASGQIVGSYTAQDGKDWKRYGFLKDGDVFITINGAAAINASGQIVGSAGFGKGYLKDGAVFTTFAVPGAASTVPTGINETGQIVGYFGFPGETSETSRFHGFLKDGATFTTIDVPGASSTKAHGINVKGQIVGSFQNHTGQHGFLKDGATFITIDGPSAVSMRGVNTEAYGIDKTGRIVGVVHSLTRTPWELVRGYRGFVATPRR